VAIGAATALAVGLPAALLAQVLEALRDERDSAGALTYVLAGVVLAGMALGGWACGRAAPDASTRRSAALGAAAGLLAVAVVLALGIVRRLVADDAVAWATVPATASLAAALAAGGGALGVRRAGRTRP
jgi:predicted permease